MQAQQREAEATLKAKQAQAESVTRGVDLACVQGQLDAANRRVSSKADQVHAQYRPRISSLAAQIKKLTEALEAEVSRHAKRIVPKIDI